jgi:hypothetical protein
MRGNGYIIARLGIIGLAGVPQLFEHGLGRKFKGVGTRAFI